MPTNVKITLTAHRRTAFNLKKVVGVVLFIFCLFQSLQCSRFCVIIMFSQNTDTELKHFTAANSCLQMYTVTMPPQIRFKSIYLLRIFKFQINIVALAGFFVCIVCRLPVLRGLFDNTIN
jgi:hypothetical protein